jgi:hypothetical protein
MKKIKNLAAMMAIVFGVFTMNACNPCRNVDCGSNGECEEGVCICDAGYEGEFCGEEMRAKFISTYSVSGSDTDGDTYSNVPVKIENSGTSVQGVLVTWDNAILMTGSVTATNSISIPNQTAGGETVEGTISGGGSSITMTLKVGTGTSAYTITASGNRQ